MHHDYFFLMKGDTELQNTFDVLLAYDGSNILLILDLLEGGCCLLL